MKKRDVLVVIATVSIFMLAAAIGAWHVGWQSGYDAAEPYRHNAFDAGQRIGHNEEHLACGKREDDAYDRGVADGSQNEIKWFTKWYKVVPKHHAVPTINKDHVTIDGKQHEIDQINPDASVLDCKTGETQQWTNGALKLACVHGKWVQVAQGCEPGSIAGQYLCTQNRKWIKLCYTKDGARVGGNANCVIPPLPPCSDGNSPCLATDGTVW